MIVRELIEKLREYARDVRVVVQGYEDGFDDISTVEEVTIQPASNPQWYYGRYEKKDTAPSRRSQQAVLLFGRGRIEHA